MTSTSDDAVQMMSSRGRQAAYLADGFVERQAAGMPSATAA